MPLARNPLVLLLLVLGALATPAHATEEAVELEVWYAVYLGEFKVGWSYQRIVRLEGEDGAKRWRNESGMVMKLERGGTELAIRNESHTVEDETGKVLRFAQVSDMGMGSMHVTGKLVDGRLEITQSGRTQTVAYPEGAVGPVRMNNLLKEKGLREGTVLEGRVFNADQPATALEVRIAVGKQEAVDVLGRVVRLWRTTASVDVLPEETVWIDDDDVTWASEIEFPMLGQMRTLRTEEALAKADLQPAEVFYDSLLEPKGTVENPRGLKRAVYRLEGKGLETAIVDGPGQKVRERGKGWVVIEVTADLLPGSPFERPFEIEGYEAYRKSTALLECEDVEVRKLAAEAAKGAGNAVDTARRIESYVRKAIDKKGFGVGFGTAAEVARGREGDCTEHGVLCAALARVAGLPSRVVVGLAYLDTRKSEKIEADGVFGYHMWTEVLIAPDVWMPIDAALGAMDATHIAMARSDLSSTSPLTDMLFPILQAMGGLRIEILEVEEPQEAIPRGGG